MQSKLFKRIYIEITNKCNLACTFCPSTNRKLESINIESFDRILKQIVSFTDYVYLHVKGEPLLHPKLNEILDLCNSHGLKVNLTTNGTLLYKNKDMLITKPALRQINISLHSFEKNILNLSFEEYINQVFLAVKQINKETNAYISFRLWNLPIDANSGDLCSSQYNIFINNKLQDFFNYTGIGENVAERIFIDYDKEFEWPDIRRPVISAHGKCLALSQQIAVLVDGTVVPCCLDNNGDIKLGNIFKQNFSDIINSEKFIIIKEGFKNRELHEPLCQRCGFIQQKFSTKSD